MRVRYPVHAAVPCASVRLRPVERSLVADAAPDRPGASDVPPLSSVQFVHAEPLRWGSWQR